MSINRSHRNSADEARTAAGASELPNVRERHLRSAAAHDAVALLEEQTAANLKSRQATTAARRARGLDDAADDEDDL